MDRHIGSRETGARHLQEQVRTIDAINVDPPGMAATRHRNGAAMSAADADRPVAPIVPSEKALPESQAPSEVTEVDFKTLKLRPGMFLQAQSTGKNVVNYHAEFLGIISGKGIMVVPNGVLSLKHGMKDGEHFVIRGFTGQYDFSFHSDVVRIFDYSYRDPPLAYALLSYPDTVTARRVRAAVRVPTSLPALVLPVGGPGPLPAMVMDLSVAGALVNSAVSPGIVGDRMNLLFSIVFEDEVLDLIVPATICRSLEPEDGKGFLTGLVFGNISRNDKLALYYFVQSSTG